MDSVALVNVTLKTSTAINSMHMTARYYGRMIRMYLF